MRDYRFYLEPSGDNVVAANVGLGVWHSGDAAYYDGIGGVFASPNSPVATTAVSLDYLRDCKRISEAKAREIHPQLFEYLG